MGSREHLSVLLFNTGCGSLPSSLTEEEKKTARPRIAHDQLTGIRRVIENTSSRRNLFVFVQDKFKGNKLKTLKTSLSFMFRFESQSELVPVYEPQVCENTYADILQDLRQGHSALYADYVYPQTFDPFIFFERLTAKITFLNGQIILLVSWHGPNTGFTDGMKSRLFRSLILSVAKVQEETDADIVVLGGDFNMELRKAQDADQKYKVLDTPTRKGIFVPDPDNANFKSSIDFVVVWPKDLVEIVYGFPKVLKFSFDKFKNLEGDPPCTIIPFAQGGGGEEEGGGRNCKLPQPFDHPRVLYRFKINRGAFRLKFIRALLHSYRAKLASSAKLLLVISQMFKKIGESIQLLQQYQANDSNGTAESE